MDSVIIQIGFVDKIKYLTYKNSNYGLQEVIKNTTTAKLD